MWKYNEKHEQKKKKKPQSTHLESSSPAKIREKTPQVFPSPFLIFSPSSSSFTPSSRFLPSRASHYLLPCSSLQVWAPPTPAWPLPCLFLSSHLVVPPLFKREMPRREKKTLPPGPLIKGGLQICPSSVELTSVRNMNTGVKGKCE